MEVPDHFFLAQNHVLSPKLEFKIFWIFGHPTPFCRFEGNQPKIEPQGGRPKIHDFEQNVKKKNVKSGSHISGRSWGSPLHGFCTLTIGTKHMKWGPPTPSRNIRTSFRIFSENAYFARNHGFLVGPPEARFWADSPQNDKMGSDDQKSKKF